MTQWQKGYITQTNHVARHLGVRNFHQRFEKILQMRTCSEIDDSSCALNYIFPVCEGGMVEVS